MAWGVSHWPPEGTGRLRVSKARPWHQLLGCLQGSMRGGTLGTAAPWWSRGAHSSAPAGALSTHHLDRGAGVGLGEAPEWLLETLRAAEAWQQVSSASAAQALLRAGTQNSWVLLPAPPHTHTL